MLTSLKGDGRRAAPNRSGCRRPQDHGKSRQGGAASKGNCLPHRGQRPTLKNSNPNPGVFDGAGVLCHLSSTLYKISGRNKPH
jgi:hypothetical protein